MPAAVLQLPVPIPWHFSVAEQGAMRAQIFIAIVVDCH